MEMVATAGALFCTLSWAGLAVLALAGRHNGNHIRWLVAASTLTAFWAAGPLLETRAFVNFYGPFSYGVEALKTYAWVGFLVALIGLGRKDMDGWLKALVGAAIVLPVVAVGANYLVELDPLNTGLSSFAEYTSGTGIMLLLVVAMLLLENLYRHADDDQRWGTRYLCIGIGLFLVYDFFLYAESLLFKRLDLQLADARAWVTGFAAPMIAVALARVRFWKVDIHVSRQVAFHSATLVAAGVYLLAMSLVGYALRQFGGEAGPVFQITFLSLAAVLLVAILASGSFRSRLRLFIARHFYSSKYDYREEWLRFITTLGSGNEMASIAQRIVWAITPIVDSTAAALWVSDRASGMLLPTVSWNYGDDLQPIERDGVLARRLRDTGTVIVRDSENDSFPSGIELPAAIETVRHTWIILALVHRGRLNGLLFLGDPRSARRLDPEDRNLLATVASQAASYLAEDRAAKALGDARKIEEFNQRFTFIAHDLKNVVNQLAILTSNAEKHGDNPEFRRDMIGTLSNAVERMNRMMQEVADRSSTSFDTTALEHVDIPDVDLVALLASVASDWKAQGPQVVVETSEDRLVTGLKGDLLISVLNHAIQNAFDACKAGEVVRLLLVKGEACAIVEVIDNGPGMEPEFLEKVYFQPFGTTREGGYGIGGFQIRQQVKDMGGKLEVITAPGQGTRVRIILPLAAPDSDSVSARNETQDAR